MRAMLLTLGAAALLVRLAVTLPNAGASTGPIPLNCNRPSSILVTEAFLIDNLKIRRVEMVGNSAAYHMNSPWPGNLSGN